jgi:zinc-binding alcohol dehydrogenase family protein
VRAVGLDRHLPVDDPACLLDLELPDPVVTGRDLLVRVRAVAVNPVDVKMRGGRIPIGTPPLVLGWDAAGVVEATGPQATLFRRGDEVWYAGVITRPGCDAELHLVDERIVGRKPRSLSFEEAAALPLTTLTAWEALFERMGLEPRASDANRARTLLVLGGAGGVGSIALQIAKRVAGLRVVASASRPESIAWCRELGADATIDHARPLRDELARIGSPDPDLILCLQATEQHLPGMADVIAPQGRICTIVETRGDVPFPTGVFQRKSVRFSWELMFTKPMFGTPDVQTQHVILDRAARLVEEGVLRTTLREREGPLSAASLRRAHARLESGHMIGKLVLGGIA